jgi:hypothetical protein
MSHTVNGCSSPLPLLTFMVAGLQDIILIKTGERKMKADEENIEDQGIRLNYWVVAHNRS